MQGQGYVGARVRVRVRGRSCDANIGVGPLGSYASAVGPVPHDPPPVCLPQSLGRGQAGAGAGARVRLRVSPPICEQDFKGYATLPILAMPGVARD